MPRQIHYFQVIFCRIKLCTCSLLEFKAALKNNSSSGEGLIYVDTLMDNALEEMRQAYSETAFAEVNFSFSHGKDHGHRRSSLASFSPNCGLSQATVSPLPSQHRIPIGLYVNKAHRLHQYASITNKVSNSSANRSTHHQISVPTIFSPAFASPPFPSRPRILITIYIRS